MDEGLQVFCSSTRLCGLSPLPQQPGVCTHKCTLLLRERNRDGRTDGMWRDERDEMEPGENKEEWMKKEQKKTIYGVDSEWRARLDVQGSG